MDYAHARHAGNAGDVFKHVALVATLEELTRSSERLTYYETHAGDGLYQLGSAGEWGDGVQRVFSASGGLLGRYAALVRGFSGSAAVRPGIYPGSPSIAAKLLRPADSTILYEIENRSASLLRKVMPAADVRESDGLAVEPSGRSLVLIDPPFTQKQEWTDTARTAARLGGAALLLWYPIKALTRPRALLAELAKLGLRGVAVELHWTPLRLKREKLNGSGMIFAGPAKAALPAFLAALPDLGAALQTHGEWSAIQIGF
ncbi:MAG TPA: 23S rRNA (adenine(2030)-N(6))-methyltransferase RlmJ [Myxococcales bacterium]|jgi:23S rRNA (adenine2030-N6)-methyltransferase|nr:23S rRNA (adenine(2030)-N(6))-methyltransferase RlmJ [Myxococcales bacterium]